MTVPFAARLDEAYRMLAAADEMDRPPAWIVDQLHAAQAEADRLLSTVQIEDGTESWVPGSRDRRARFVAALMGCAPCPHLPLPTPGLILVNLNLREVACLDCAQVWRDRWIDDNRCELCDEEPEDRLFRSFSVSTGGHLFVGNAGSCCWHWLDQ